MSSCLTFPKCSHTAFHFLPQVGVLNKLGLLVPAYTARAAELLQQLLLQQCNMHGAPVIGEQQQQQQQQQRQRQQLQLEGLLAELRLVLVVLENCTFTCVENENELLRLQVRGVLVHMSSLLINLS